MIKLTENVCQNIHSAMLREWIDTNGKGGYASSTILGMNTRRYHGLLVAALNPPVNRQVLVSKVEETLVISGDKYSISCNQYPNNIYPEGYKYLKEFRLNPFPHFIYEIENEYRLEKTVFMLHGKNATAVRYVIFPGSGDIELYLRPMLSFRHFHHLNKTKEPPKPMVKDLNISSKSVKILSNYIDTPLYIYHDADVFKEKGFWYNNFEYREEVYRGYECHEDLYNPGYFIYTFTAHEKYEAWLVFSTEPMAGVTIDSVCEAEISRRAKLVKNLDSNLSFLEPVVLAADSFIAQRDDKPNSTIIAGYHWFNDWSRDTLIALPGLTLSTGRFDIAKQILALYISKLHCGLLPNFFDEENKPVYNSVDASLWYFYALYKYIIYTGDLKFAEHLLPNLKSIIKSYINSVFYGLKMNKMALIQFDEAKIPLTWMDAIGSDSRAKTRKGMVIEINALWYMAVKVMEYLSAKLGDLSEAAMYLHMAQDIEFSFDKVFWDGELGYLYDFVDGDYKEKALRPNQILAIGLPFSALKKEHWEPVINIIKQKLLTPYGLRSLEPGHPCFSPYCRGGEKNRDTAYHQGSVWTWLLGFYASAVAKHNGKTPETIDYLKSIVEPFKEHLKVGAIGTISEIFDGTLPYYFRGCVSQAWSVGEILRVYGEEILSNSDELHPILNTEKAHMA